MTTPENAVTKNKAPNITFDMPDSRNKSVRGESLFSLSSNTLNSSTKSLKKDDYFECVNREKNSWHQLFRDTTKSIKNEPVKIDMSILSESQRAYCEQIITLNKFQNESAEFIKYADFYLKFIDSIDTRKKNLCGIIDGRISSKMTDICVDNIDLVQFQLDDLPISQS